MWQFISLTSIGDCIMILIFDTHRVCTDTKPEAGKLLSSLNKQKERIRYVSFFEILFDF